MQPVLELIDQEANERENSPQCTSRCESDRRNYSKVSKKVPKCQSAKKAKILRHFTDVAMLIDIILLGAIQKVIICRILVYLPNVTNFENSEINNRFK